MLRHKCFVPILALLLADVSYGFSLREKLSWLLHRDLEGQRRSYRPQYAGVMLEKGSYRITSKKNEGSVAHAYYVDSAKTVSGFGQLWVKTSDQYSDYDQMYAAGMVEGWLSAERIWHHFHNIGDYFRRSANVSDFEDAYQWLDEHYEWLQMQLMDNATAAESALWQYVNLTHAQFLGMVAGYAAKCDHLNDSTLLPPLSRRDLLMLSSVGDFDDILAVTDKEGVPRHRRWASLDAHELKVKLAVRGKCSAMVKVTGDLSDILMAHSAWFSYSGMQRIYKHYDFALHNAAVKSKRMSFSSYPGELSSDDDFYIMSSGLVVLQTTNDVHNESMYDYTTPRALLNWQRVRAANALSGGGEEWAETVSQYNSGTYNNQYMVVNLNLFRPGKELRKGLLWVVEQAPGLSLHADHTAALERSYWPSYNVPYFTEMYHEMGYADLESNQSRRGDAFERAVMGVNYQLSPRAKIFRRDHGTAHNLMSLKQLMRSNCWSNDPYSDHNPLGAVCGRGDLDAKLPTAYGCIDTKVTNFRMAQQLLAEAINGPTTDGGLRPFKWTDSFHEAHLGQPKVFSNSFEVMEPDAETLGFESM